MIEATSPGSNWTTMGWRSVMNVFLCGAIIGVVTYILFMLFDRYVYQLLLCGDSRAALSCDASAPLANGTAIILGSMLGLILMVRERVYRPILAIIGVTITVWGMFFVLASLPWIVLLLAAALVFGISYVLYTWVAQPTNLIVAVGGTILLVVITRLILA